MSNQVIIKTNSSYSYLWPILNDLTRDFDKVYLLCDDTKSFKFNKNIEPVIYDTKQTYTMRLSNYLNTLSCKYILLIHDVDLILNFNIDKFNILLSIAEQYSIDRISLGVFKSTNPSDDIQEFDMKLCELKPKMSKNFFTPFDYSPSIYNRVKLIDFYSSFPEETYRNLEVNPLAQDYITNNFKSYGLSHGSYELIYHRGFVYTNYFNFLHITVQGMFLSPSSYFDLRGDFEKIKDKYMLELEYQDTTFIQKNELT